MVEASLPIAGRVPGNSWAGILEITLAVAPESVPRRLDFEVHVGGNFRLRLRARALVAGHSNRLISFRFPLSLAATDPATRPTGRLLAMLSAIAVAMRPGKWSRWFNEPTQPHEPTPASHRQ